MNEKISSNFKKSFANYIDIALATMNSLIIIFPLIIVHKNLIISTVGIILSCGNLALIYYTYIKNNPFYIYYCFVMLFYGFLFLLPSIWINMMMGCLFIPNIIYILKISKGSSHTSALGSYAKYQYLKRFAIFEGFNARQLSQQWDNINPELELKRQKERELLEKHYHSMKILIISLLLSLSWLVIFVLYTIAFMAT